MIVVHAVAEAGERGIGPVADRLGLQRYDAHGLVVLHREQPDAPVAEAASVLAFGETLRDLAQGRTVLPMRFGSVVADRAGLAALVEDQHVAWGDLLRSLTGRVELIVHLPEPAPAGHPGLEPGADPNAGSGRDYLTARAAAVHAEEERLEALRALAPVEAVCRLRGHRASLLVAAADAEEARVAVASWASSCGWQHVAVTGPWPPFSFCEEVTR